MEQLLSSLPINPLWLLVGYAALEFFMGRSKKFKANSVLSGVFNVLMPKRRNKR